MDTRYEFEILKADAMDLFGVGGHVMVGAASAGLLDRDGLISIPEADTAIRDYLATPVEGS